MDKSGKKDIGPKSGILNGQAVRGSDCISAEQLRKMKEVDIRAVDRSQLVEISEVEIDTSLPDRERMLDFVQKIGNPYCYLDHGTVVKISFGGGSRLEDCLKKCVHLG